MTLLNNGLRSNSLHQNAQNWRRKPTIYGPGGGSAPVYATGAVSFDGATWLVNNGLLVADSPNLLVSCLVYYTDLSLDPTLGIVDPQNTATNLFGTDTDGFTDFEVDPVGGGPSGPKTVTVDPLVIGQPYHILARAYNDVSNNKAIQFYLNDVAVPVNFFNPSAGFNMVWNNLPFWIGSDSFGDNHVGWLGEYWYGAGQGAGFDLDITANRRKFNTATGAPVNLGSDGSLATGISPIVYLHQPAGNNDPSQFAINRGTNTNFTWTGNPTAGPWPPP